MKNTLVVVTDLGSFKVFRLENSEVFRTPRLQLLEEFNMVEAHSRLVDKVTDLSGRFPRAGQSGQGNAMSDGERHNIRLEQRKRLVRQLAQRLNQLAGASDVESCFLAASKEINHQLLDELTPQVRAKILKNIPADLTKMERADLLQQFRV